MSNTETAPVEEACGGEEAPEAVIEVMEGREVQLTPRSGTHVTRTLPNRERRMVGAWCFLDAYGPTVFEGSRGMNVAAHPHTGLQTVTWLVAGEVRHHDSLGNNQVIRPGQLNLMTAGRGIAHAELTPRDNSGVLHGAQLWVALPGGDAHTAPHFEHHAGLPVVEVPGATATVLMGSLDGAESGAKAYSPLVGAEIALESAAVLPLRKDFEYALLVLSGTVGIGQTTVTQGPLLYLGRGRERIRLEAREPSRLLLLGGEPFEEEIVMWWNFVGRTHEEIVGFREEWESGSSRFAPVTGGYEGGTLPAPPLPATRLKPRGRLRYS